MPNASFCKERGQVSSRIHRVPHKQVQDGDLEDAAQQLEFLTVMQVRFRLLLRGLAIRVKMRRYHAGPFLSVAPGSHHQGGHPRLMSNLRRP